jgi:hypothetical protein
MFNRLQERDDNFKAHAGILSGSKAIRSWSNHDIVTGKKSGLR